MNVENRVAIVSDSMADIPEEYRNSLDIQIVQGGLSFGGESFSQDQLSPQEFVRRMAKHLKRTGELPKSNAPNPYDYYRAINTISRKSNLIVVTIAPPPISSSYDNALAGLSMYYRAEELDKPESLRQNASHEQIGQEMKDKVQIINSQSVSMGSGLLAVMAAEMAKRGMPCEDICKEIYDLIPRISVVFTIDTLRNLHAGGRISRTRELIASMLKIKPVIEINQSKDTVLMRPRTREKSLTELVNIVTGQVDLDFPYLSVLYLDKMEDLPEFGGNRELRYRSARNEASELADRISDYYTKKIIFTEVGSVVGVHAGPGAVAVAYVKKRP
ncbi:MAG: DegV family protein [Patescibacteria group bacterium]|nr:DegV family protein [Patescibacteria group bacterium]